MFDFLKDLGILIFNVAEEIEKKTEEFRKEGEEKFKNFEEKTKEKREEFKKKYEEELGKIKEEIEKFFSKFNFATKDDIKEIKNILTELNQKIDSLLNK